MSRRTMKAVLMAVTLAVCVTASASPAQSAGTAKRPRIKLTLVTPKLSNHQLVLTSSSPVEMKFTVANTGNVPLRRVFVELSPRAIFVKSKPSAHLVSDSTGGSARWHVAKLKVKHKKTFYVTVQFDFSQQPNSAFGLETWAPYRGGYVTDYHLQRVAVHLQQ